MSKKQTREELVSEIAVLNEQLEKRTKNELALREEFTQAFYTPRETNDVLGLYRFSGTTSKKETLSWSQIFVEIGKIILNDKMGNLAKENYDLHQKINILENPDNPANND